VVYSLLPAPEDQSHLVEELRSSGIPIEFLAARSWLSFPRVIFSLRRLLKRQQPDLVQAFLFHANFVAAIAARLAQVRRVVTNLRVAEPRHWHRWLLRLVDRFVARHVCVSRGVESYAGNVVRLPASKLVVINNGIDLQRFENPTSIDLGRFGVAEGRRVMTYIGRLAEQKGVDWLLSVTPRIFGVCRNHDLLIVGDGPDRKKLEQMARQQSVEKQVHFTGWCPEVTAILEASDVLVLPSRWEGMPNVVLEAMAAGKPVVAYDVEGISELLGPLGSDQVAAARDSDGFVIRLTKVLSDDARAVQLGRENRRRAEQQFTVERMVREYDRLYRSLLLDV
jgi:glycosyltransferase involved in cell wall biosynthesis